MRSKRSKKLDVSDIMKNQKVPPSSAKVVMDMAMAAAITALATLINFFILSSSCLSPFPYGLPSIPSFSLLPHRRITGPGKTM